MLTENELFSRNSNILKKQYSPVDEKQNRTDHRRKSILHLLYKNDTSIHPNVHYRFAV